MNKRYLIQNVEQIPSPSLVVYLDMVKYNIDRAIEMVNGQTDKLRPHVKTHKTPQITNLQLEAGISKHKCATLKEAQMLVGTGASDILIAYQMIGPNITRLVDMIDEFPTVDFQVIADHPDAVSALSHAMHQRQKTVKVMLDFNVGMNRTGISLQNGATNLYRQIEQSAGLTAWGLHIYDGHIHDGSLADRQRSCQQSLDLVEAFKRELGTADLPNVVMGGTPTFPVYAKVPNVETSPGTFVFTDFGYSTRYPDLGFVPAALLLTRVISLPTDGRITLDLGHKAIGADPQGARGQILNLSDATLDAQHEEHWAVNIPPEAEVSLGQEIYVCPTHICPTVALHEFYYVVDETGGCIDQWQVTARTRN
ncbi:alanine racemase [Candidatus Poribacteria bacterium]|nr:alanine racemase [Candidatus Poribacteria bacterium]